MKNKITRVSETNLGVYVWQMINGDFLADEDLNVLSITSMRDDLVKMANITKVAKNLGFGDGSPVFLEGRRKIDDEEFEEQKARSAEGLVPDKYDIGIYKEGLNRK